MNGAIGGGIGAGGGGLYLLSSALSGAWKSPPPPSPLAEELSAHMKSWPSDYYQPPAGYDKHVRADAVDEDCVAFNGTSYDPLGCSRIAVGRMAAAAVRLAEKRAVACGVAMGTDCILGPEVGLNIPAVFVYEHGAGMRALLAPRPLKAPEGSEPRRVRLLDPRTENALDGPAVRFNSSINVEFMLVSGGNTRLETSELNGTAAYCVQLLRHAYPPTCWKALD